jgi:hypothetical protein
MNYSPLECLEIISIILSSSPPLSSHIRNLNNFPFEN